VSGKPPLTEHQRQQRDGTHVPEIKGGSTRLPSDSAILQTHREIRHDPCTGNDLARLLDGAVAAGDGPGSI